MVLALRGDYERALPLAVEGLAIAEEIGHRQWTIASLCALGRLHQEILSLETAREYLERALALSLESGFALWVKTALNFLISTCVAQGDLERARDKWERLLEIASERGDLKGLLLSMRARVALERVDPTAWSGDDASAMSGWPGNSGAPCTWTRRWTNCCPASTRRSPEPPWRRYW